MAKLYFRYSAMEAGKTLDVLRTAYNYERKGGRVLVAKPAIDTKGDNRIVSRTGMGRVVDLLITPGMRVAEQVRQRRLIGERALSAVLIDEAQFLEPPQVDELLTEIVIRDGVPVLAWGLRTDFQTHSFAGSRRLFELAHELAEIVTMCGNGNGCEHKAVFNARKVGDSYVTDGDRVAIDGEANVTYESLCARHYMENVGPILASE